ncbi:MAG TPA: ATP-binding protein [Polyangiaceae bacterium]|nr:ATP-binding protein [Polyangiaceae bacterium]
MLGEHLDASRVLFVELDEGKEVVIHREWIRRGQPLVGRYPWCFIGPALMRAWSRGEPFVVENARTDSDLDHERAAFEAIGCCAGIACGLKKDGKFVTALCVQSAVPRRWTEEEKGLVRDLSERTWAEVQRAHSELSLRKSEEKYRSLFTSIDEGFCMMEVITNAEGRALDVRYLETNPAFERHTGFLNPAGRTYRELTGKEPEPPWLELHESVLRTGDPKRMDGFSDAIGRWYEISISRVGPPEHRCLACVFKDISERKKADALMRLALEREQTARAVAEEATALREEFISVVSHELRTPISAIVIWSTALRSGAVRPDQFDGALEAIVASANLQHRLIDELLDMARLVSGKMQIAVQDEELGAIVKQAVAVLQPTALARRVELHAEAIGARAYCLVDRERLHQVLWNVIGNAIKFTPAGGHVQVALRSTADTAVIDIKDDGPGIPTSFLPYVFDRFRQADMSQTRSFGGLGLGLSIARQLVELHGGTITAASDGPGCGATFRIELPLTAAGVGMTFNEAPSDGVAFSAKSALRGRRVLLVEDESHTRAALTWLLESCGAEVVAVAEGGAAREATALGARFDVLVCDLGLPTEDGCSLLRALRHFPDSPLPALALTAYVCRGDRERARAAGFDAFLPKPIAPDRFIETIAALVS